jgi:hypothetical protein
VVPFGSTDYVDAGRRHGTNWDDVIVNSAGRERLRATETPAPAPEQ